MNSPRPAVLPSDQLEPVVRIGRRARRFWRSGAVVLIVGVAIAVAFALFRPKQFRSDASLYYREGIQWSSSEATSSRRAGPRLRDMLLAHAQLTRVIKDERLFPELVSAGRIGEAVEHMRLRVQFRFDQSDIFVISYTGDSPDEAQRVTGRLTQVLMDENTRLRAQQAEVAKQFLDAEKTRKAAELHEKEVEQLRFLARHPEFATEQSQAIGVSLRARPRALTPRDESALGALRREEQRLRRLISNPDQIQPVPADPTLVAARNEADARLASAQRELAERRGRFTEQHPDVRVAVTLVAEAEAAQKRAADALAATQRPVPLGALRERLQQVEAEIAAYRRDHAPATPQVDPVERSDAAKRIVAVETEWARLTREVTEARERLQALETQQFTASMTASMLTSGQISQMVVVDPAYLPAVPVGWPTRKIALAGLGAALLLALLWMLARAFVDDLIWDRSDLDRLGLAPLLAIVPPPPASRPPAGAPVAALAPPPPVAAPAAAFAAGAAAVQVVKAPPGREALAIAAPPQLVRVQRVVAPSVDECVVVVNDPDSRSAAAFRLLRHRLQRPGAPQTLLVTSPAASEGKTFVAVNLALAIAEAGRGRVVLVEANFRSPSIARLLRVDPPVCFGEQLADHHLRPERPWVLVETAAPGFHVAAVRPGAPARPLLDARALILCVDELRQAGYDYVVVDTPATLASADVNIVAESVDAVVMTLRERRSRLRAFREAAEQVGVDKLAGVVLLGA